MKVLYGILIAAGFISASNIVWEHLNSMLQAKVIIQAFFIIAAVAATAYTEYL